MDKPDWFNAATLVPPGRKPFRVSTKPKKIFHHEDRLLRSYYQRLGKEEYKYLHIPGAESEGPAVAFVRRQLEVMKAESKTEKEAFKVVQAEAESSGKVYDAALNLAVTTADERQRRLEGMADNYQEEEVMFTKHVKEIAGHVTEAFIQDTMIKDSLSREVAEQKAIKQREFDRRGQFDSMRKATAESSSPPRHNKNARNRSPPKWGNRGGNNDNMRGGHSSDPLRVAGQGPKATKQD